MFPELETLAETTQNAFFTQKGRKMTGGGWSCPHELEGRCSKAKNLPCDPGMKGCELYGRYVFFDASKNKRQEQRKAREDKYPLSDEDERND